MTTTETSLRPSEVAEQAIRRFMNDHPDLPVAAEFFRGIDRSGYVPQVRRERAVTPSAGTGWHVLVIPGHSDAAISAQELDPFGGTDVIGGGVADVFAYPKTDDGEVDAQALAGEAFQALLAAEVDKKLTVIAEARAAKGES